MSLKDILKNAGLVSEDPSNQDTDDSAETKAPIARPMRRMDNSALGGNRPLPPNNFAPFGQSMIAGALSAAPDAEIVDALTQATVKAQALGYDKFRTNLTTLEGMPDLQRYQMAIKLTQANFNITPEKIVASLDACLSAVETERTNYESAFNEQVKQEVTDVQNVIQKKVDEIAKLNAEVAELNQKALAAQNRLTQEKATFDASHVVVSNGLTAERQKVVSFITPTAK